MLRFIRVYFASFVTIFFGAFLLASSGVMLSQPDVMAQIGVSIMAVGFFILLDRLVLTIILPKESDESNDLRYEIQVMTDEIARLTDAVRKLTD